MFSLILFLVFVFTFAIYFTGLRAPGKQMGFISLSEQIQLYLIMVWPF